MTQLDSRPRVGPPFDDWYTLPDPLTAVPFCLPVERALLTTQQRGEFELLALGSRGEPVLPPRWVAPLQAKLRELWDLPERWDGRRAGRVTQQALVGCVDLLGLVLSEDSPAPFVVPLPDGGLQAEWHAGDRHIELEIAGSGAIGAWAESARGVTLLDEDWSALPDEPSLVVLRKALGDLVEAVRDVRGRSWPYPE